MTRSTVSLLALLLLIALTGASWALAGEGSSARSLGALAVFKGLVILGVFLELDRAWPGWAAMAALVLAIFAGGAALIVGG